MSPGVQGKPAAAESVREELEKILAAKPFAGSARLGRFLRFVVEETLADHGDRLKEYTIATEVYEKGDSFDARIDPIVRVEARRLRHRLKEYYATDGATDRLRIELPKGSYVPRFDEVQAPKPPVERASGGKPRVVRVAALAAIAIVGLGYLGWSRFNPGAGASAARRVMLVVLPFQNLTGDREQEYLSDGMTEEMSVQLGSLDPQRLGVIARTSAMKYKRTSKGVDEIGKELVVDYVLEGSVQR